MRWPIPELRRQRRWPGLGRALAPSDPPPLTPVTNGDAAAAITRLEATLRFRRSLNLYDVDATAKLAEEETKYGTRYIAGWNGTRTVNYIFLNRNPLPLEDRKMVHNMFMFERMMDLTPAGQQEICTVFNFGGKKEGPTPGLGPTKEMLDNYDKHYPLQPSLTLLQEMGWAMKAFVNMVWPFIGAEQREKTVTKTGEQAVKDGQFAPQSLVKKCGGSLDVSRNGRWQGADGSSSTTTACTGPRCCVSPRPVARRTLPTGSSSASPRSGGPSSTGSLSKEEEGSERAEGTEMWRRERSVRREIPRDWRSTRNHEGPAP